MHDDNFEIDKEQILRANADYESQVAEGYSPNIKALERWYHIPLGTLKNFRANRKRRIHGKITPVAELKGTKCQVKVRLQVNRMVTPEQQRRIKEILK